MLFPVYEYTYREIEMIFLVENIRIGDSLFLTMMVARDLGSLYFLKSFSGFFQDAVSCSCASETL